MRAIVVDDEAPARELLRALLGAWPAVTIVGEAGDVDSARRLFADARPDIAFLDVQMPGGTGFDVLASIPPEQMPLVVFTTAYDEYALRAFEVSACDYLLKPFDASRLARTMERVLDLGARNDRQVDARLRTLLSHVTAQLAGPAAAPSRPSADDSVVVRSDGRHLFLQAADIEWIEAVGKEVRIHTTRGAVTAREAIGTLEARLDPADFIRVQRSAIVNRRRIRQVQPWFKGDHVIVMESGAKVVTGRTYRAAVMALLGQIRK